MRARSPLSLVMSLSLLLAASPGVNAQGLGLGTVGQEGTAVPAQGLPELSLGSRLLPLRLPEGSPTMGLRLGAWSGGSLGLSYSRSGPYGGNPHELEFSLKQRLLSEYRGDPFSASLLGAVNTGAYSMDAELAMSREFGPMALLGTVRLLGNAQGSRTPLGGLGLGARLALTPRFALLGDVFQTANAAGAIPAWGAGLQLQLPAVPYAVTVLLANTASTTRQGASLGTPDLRFGIDLALSSSASRPPSMGGPQGGVSRRSHGVPYPSSPSVPMADSSPEVAPQPAPKPSPQASKPTPQASKPSPQARKPAPKASKPSPRASQPKLSGQASRTAHVQPGATATPAPRRESELWIVMIREGHATPAQVQLRRGSSVTWFNRDAVPHSLAARGWETGDIAQGKQVTRRFDAAGTFPYRCRLHPQEGGTITVR